MPCECKARNLPLSHIPNAKTIVFVFHVFVVICKNIGSWESPLLLPKVTPACLCCQRWLLALVLHPLGFTPTVWRHPSPSLPTPTPHNQSRLTFMFPSEMVASSRWSHPIRSGSLPLTFWLRFLFLQTVFYVFAQTSYNTTFTVGLRQLWQLSFAEGVSSLCDDVSMAALSLFHSAFFSSPASLKVREVEETEPSWPTSPLRVYHKHFRMSRIFTKKHGFIQMLWSPLAAAFTPTAPAMRAQLPVRPQFFSPCLFPRAQHPSTLQMDDVCKAPNLSVLKGQFHFLFPFLYEAFPGHQWLKFTSLCAQPFI